MQKTNKYKIIEFLKTLLTAIIIAGLFRSFLYEPFHIPSGSMKPGLLPGDFILVSKYSYGYSRYSFPFALAPINNRILSKTPERGEVVVFRLPANPKINYIKRLVGVPCDKVQMLNGILYINGKIVPKTKSLNNFFDEDMQQFVPTYIETFPMQHSFEILDAQQNALQDNTPIYTVPPNHYFFMGDNRDHSQDSRYIRQVGFVHEKYIIGKAQIIFMSAEDSLLKLWKLPFSIRFSRLFDLIK